MIITSHNNIWSVIHKPCWDACCRCSCNGLELCKCMIWHLSRLTHTSRQLTQKGKYKKSHDSNNTVSPGRESEMYSHYNMLCEHSWWYLYLDYSSQPHHRWIHTNCYIIIFFHHQKMNYILGIIGGKLLNINIINEYYQLFLDIFHGQHNYIRSGFVFDMQLQFTSKPVNARSGTYLDWYSQH